MGKKKKKKKNLSAELGPDHYFHVVPGVSESSLAAKGGYLHRCGGCRAHVARFVIAPASRRHAPYPFGLLTHALRSIPPVVRSLTCFALWCGLAGQLGIASPLSGKLPEACLFTPCSGVVQFHSPQTSTQAVWTVTPGVVFRRPRLGTVVKQRRKRTGWASQETAAPHPLFLE